MDDYISRQIIKDGMIKYGFRAPDMTVTEFVEDLPAAPVREVKRGKWIIHEDLPYSECPFCNARWSHITENFRYCFYCGADLREDA